MGVLFKDNAMRFALRLSANSTQPSAYFCLRFPLQSEHGMRRGVFSKYRTNRRRRSYPCRNLALRASSSAAFRCVQCAPSSLANSGAEYAQL